MTYFGTTDSTNHLTRILPLPYLPTYISRRPAPAKSNSDLTTCSYYPIFATNWQKLSSSHAKKNRDYNSSIDTESESVAVSPKQYDTYKSTFHRTWANKHDLSSTDALNRSHPLAGPNHITQTSLKWSQFLDEYPDRFKIEYPVPDDVDDLYLENNHGQYDANVMHQPGRYPYQTEKDSLGFNLGYSSRIEPVTNPFRQSDVKQTSATIRPIWLPYGTAPRRYQKP